MSKMRQKIAERLKDSQNTYAMLTTFNEVDMTNAMNLRNEFGQGLILILNLISILNLKKKKKNSYFNFHFNFNFNFHFAFNFHFSIFLFNFC